MNKSRKNLSISIAIAIGITLSSMDIANAQFNKEEAVTFNGSPMFEIKGNAGGFTPKKRAWLAQDNFDNALVLASDRSPTSVKVVKENNAYKLELDGRYIVSADSNSANIKNVSPEKLANRWAESIRNKLRDKSSVNAYVAKLTKDNALSADMTIVERKLYAPAGTILPITLAEGVLLSNTQSPRQVKAILSKDVIFDSYSLPKNSILVGNVVKSENGSYMIKFSSITTPSGTEIKLDGLPARLALKTMGARAIEHKRIPANSITESREPATVGIGANRGAILVLQPSQKSIKKGTDLSLAFEQPTHISVKMRSN